MKRLVLIACATAVLAAGCGGDPAAAPTPSPQRSVPPGVIPQVDETRNTVGRLNDLQNRTEQQTGGAGYAP